MKPYYQEGGITIYHCDCREILPSIRHHAEVMITDPPYGMAYKSGWSGSKVANDKDTAIRDEILTIWNDPALVFGRWSCPRPARTKTVLIWNKGDWPGMGDLSLPWGPSWEEIYVIGEGWIGSRRGSILHYAQRPSGAEGYHPTEKPLSLMVNLVSATRPPFTVIDPFMGAGTTLVAAQSIGRRAIGIEIHESYCEIAAKRLSQGILSFEEANTCHSNH